MKLIETKIHGAFILESPMKNDSRGAFCKIYNSEAFLSNSLKFDTKEIYYNVSRKNVMRGMHFQVPPHQHSKLIKCVSGEILDVFLDIRKESSSYLKFDVIRLKENDSKSIFLPEGIAHGFLSLSDKTVVLYNVSSVYNSEYDKGILWSSFGFDWPCENPILSNRDNNLQRMNEFKSPF
tara:strand:- start:24 stop:560 length:537 start_codon:yes stop_codon:yes gene_type:complete